MPPIDLVLAPGTPEWMVSRAAEACAEAGSAAAQREYFVVLHPGSVPLAGGIARMLEAADAHPDAERIVGVSIPVGATGEIHRDGVRAHTRRHLKRARRFGDASYLTVYGNEEIAAVLCRGARPAALELTARGFADFLDSAARAPCVVVHDPVCATVDAEPRVTPSMAGSTRAVLTRLRGAMARLRAHARSGVATSSSRMAMSSAAVTAALGLEGAATRIDNAYALARQRFEWRFVRPVTERAYDALLARLGEWPIAWRAREAAPPAPRKVAYYLWRFPVLSETFIQRELRALEAAGVSVAIVADAPGGGETSDPDLLALRQRTIYVLPVRGVDVARDLAFWLLRRPLCTANLFAYTFLRPYNVPKSPGQDARVFLKSLRLARILHARGVTQVHAPWGDTNAFIAMVAARLAGIDFSLQFRAQDLHRTTLSFQVAEKVHNARFVVTNTKYNADHLRSLARVEDHAKIHQIYNGLPLERLTPGVRTNGDNARGPLQILSVARLIEQKGLPYLFEACRMLLDRGLDVRCQVIGGPELPRYVNDFIEIRRSRARLGLEDVVDLAGAQPFPRVIEAYRQADVFALPCVIGADASRDIIPNAILEAMAMGVAVVATPVTAVPELLVDGESGLLVPPNDALALANAIERLIADPSLRARLAANARARVAERFDVGRNIRAYVELFTRP